MGLYNKVTSDSGKRYLVSTVKKDVKNYPPGFNLTGQVAVYEGSGLFRKELKIYINYCGEEAVSLNTVHNKVVSLLKNAKEPVGEYLLNSLNVNGSADLDEDVVVPWAKDKTNILLYEL